MPPTFIPPASIWQMRPFSALHGVVVAVLILAIAGLVRAARRRPDAAGRALGLAGLGVWAANQAHALLRDWPALDRAASLPLHVCDLVGLAAPLALLTRNRWWMAVTWFAGCGLSLQALVTPALEGGPDTWAFWLFWAMHGGIFAAAAVLVAARGYRPAAGDFARAWVASLAYVLLVLPLDLATGWNYGYVGPALPDTPTVLDHLGPWPWRIGVLCVLATGVYGLLWLPFAWGRRRAAGAAAAPGDPGRPPAPE